MTIWSAPQKKKNTQEWKVSKINENSLVVQHEFNIIAFPSFNYKAESSASTSVRLVLFVALKTAFLQCVFLCASLMYNLLLIIVFEGFSYVDAEVNIFTLLRR
jgi:hypothetical protein